jgi:hypothetical protein
MIKKIEYEGKCILNPCNGLHYASVVMNSPEHGCVDFVIRFNEQGSIEIAYIDTRWITADDYEHIKVWVLDTLKKLKEGEL